MAVTSIDKHGHDDKRGSERWRWRRRKVVASAPARVCGERPRQRRLGLADHAVQNDRGGLDRTNEIDALAREDDGGVGVTARGRVGVARVLGFAVRERLLAAVPGLGEAIA